MEENYIKTGKRPLKCIFLGYKLQPRPLRTPTPPATNLFVVVKKVKKITKSHGVKCLKNASFYDIISYGVVSQTLSTWT